MEQLHMIGALCRILNEWSERPADFIPEGTGRVPGASVWAESSENSIKRKYINGETVWMLPFQVRRYVAGVSPAEKIEALSFFDRCTEYLTTHLPVDECFRCEAIKRVSTPAQRAVWEDGTTEYAARYVLEYRII